MSYYYPPYPPSGYPPSPVPSHPYPPPNGTHAHGTQGAGTWATLGYDIPSLNYQPTATMGPWDLARALYPGSLLERSVFDALLAEAPNFTRHLKEREARKAHRRVYVRLQADRNSKHYGGAAAFHAFLLWERDHQTVFHQYAPAENRDRLVAMALGEVYALFERMQPTRARLEESCEWAAGTAKHLFDLYYDAAHASRRREVEREYHRHGYSHSHGHPSHSSHHGHGYGHGHGHYGHYGGHRRHLDDSTDSDSELELAREREHRRRRSEYGYYQHQAAMHAQAQAQAVAAYSQAPVPVPVPVPGSVAGQYCPPQAPYPPYAYASPAYPPVQAVPVAPYPAPIDPLTGYPYRTDPFGNPLDSRSWYYGYARY